MVDFWSGSGVDTGDKGPCNIHGNTGPVNFFSGTKSYHGPVRFHLEKTAWPRIQGKLNKFLSINIVLVS